MIRNNCLRFASDESRVPESNALARALGVQLCTEGLFGHWTRHGVVTLRNFAVESEFSDCQTKSYTRHINYITSTLMTRSRSWPWQPRDGKSMKWGPTPWFDGPFRVSMGSYSSKGAL